MLKRPEIFIFRTPFCFRMYQVKFTQEVSIQHSKAVFKLHTVYFATDVMWHPYGNERVNA